MRSELIHPMLAHFPLALLGVYPFVYTSQFFFKNPIKDRLEWGARGLLYLGIVLYMVTLYLGDMALEIVTPKLCQLSLAYDHETWGYYGLYSWGLVLVLDISNLIGLEKKLSWIKFLPVGKAFFSFLALLTLYQAGHSGAGLVYEFGAAVKNAVCP
jgi:uncharacterized membrane protein